MIPLVTVTGFLGSGKTTFLKRIIEANPDHKLAFLVNEFGPVDVDGRVLATSTERVITLPGGSIFCRCLVTSFIGRMSEIAEQWNTSDAPLEGVVVEASGIADPGVLPQMLEETGLSARYRPVQVISLVDPGTFPQLLQTLPNIAAQVRASTTAVVNKTDLYDEDSLARTEEMLRQVNPSVHIVRAVHARTDLARYEVLFRTGPALPTSGTYALCRDPHYASITLDTPQPVEPDRLLDTLKSLGPDLYRAKGFVWTGNECIRLDASAGRITTERTTGHAKHTKLVLIFNPSLERSLQKKLAGFGLGPDGSETEGS